MEEEMKLARRLGLEVVGFDVEFGVWVLGEHGSHPLIDDPKYRSEHETGA